VFPILFLRSSPRFAVAAPTKHNEIARRTLLIKRKMRRSSIRLGPNMPHRFDATLKDIVADYPGDFTPLGIPKRPATVLNVDLSTISGATDVALGFGNPVDEIVDLNFQSGPDVGLPARLHLYNAAL
jgi:hypothetical protein